MARQKRKARACSLARFVALAKAWVLIAAT